MIANLPLNALRAFEVAARHRSMSRAAEELCVTHGAVSRQIRQLEDYLGTALFYRQPGGLVLTAAGNTLVQPARSAFQLLEAGIHDLRRQLRPGALQVACPGTFLMRWLMPRLYRFNSQTPTVELRLLAESAPVWERDDVDVAIGVGQPPWPREAQVTALFAESFGPVLAPSLAASLTLDSPASLRHAPRLQTASRPTVWNEWGEISALGSDWPAAGQHFERLYFMLEAAAAGIGVAIAPAVLVADDLAAGRLVAPFGFVASGHEYYVAWRKGSADNRAKQFVAWLRQEALVGTAE